jgi:hypothetical protein
MLKKTAPGWREAAGTARGWLAAAGTARRSEWGSEGWRTPGLAARFAFACPTAAQRRAANCKTGEGGSILVHALLKLNSWTYNFVEVSGHKLESSQTQSLRIQLLYYKPVSNQFWSRGGGVKTISRGGCGQQGGKISRLLSQWRPRIRHLFTATSNFLMDLNFVYFHSTSPIFIKEIGV